MRIAGSFLIATASMVLAACSTATPYQPYLAGHRAEGGYSQAALGEARYRVSFAGNDVASRERVERYLLYRAAELTLESGYDWFEVSDRHTDAEIEVVARVERETPTGRTDARWRPHWDYKLQGAERRLWHPESGEPLWDEPLDERKVERYEAHAEIALRRGAAPVGDPSAFDARQVMAELGSSVERPKSGRR